MNRSLTPVRSRYVLAAPNELRGNPQRFQMLKFEMKLLRLTTVLVAMAAVTPNAWAQADEPDLEKEAGAASKKVEKKSSLVEEVKPTPEQAKKKADDDSLKKGEFDYERLESLGLTQKERDLQMEKIKALQRTIKTIKDMLDRNPRPDNAPDLYFRLAEAYWELSHFTYLSQMVEYNKQVDAWDKSPEAHRPAKPVPPVENYQESLTWYEKILQQSPNYNRMSEVLYRLGKAALQQGKALQDKVLSNKGVQYLNKLVQNYQQSPYIANTHLALAEHFFEANNLTLAKMNYEKITQNYKTAGMYNYALYKLGWVYYNLREFRRTIETFQQVIKEIGTDKAAGKIEFRDQALKDLVQVFCELDHGWPEAKDYFAQAEGEKQMWFRLTKMVEIYVATDKDENAIELLHLFLETFQTDKRAVDWHEQIIDIRKKIGNFPDIEKAVRDFLAFSDERTSAWVAANKSNAEAFDKAQKMGETLLLYVANHHHQAAQKIEEESKEPALAKPEYVAASKDYGEFVRRYPNSKKAYIVLFYKAEIEFDQLKEYEMARQDYRSVIELDTQGEYVEDAALGLLYSVEELMRKTHVCLENDKWVEKSTCPSLVPDNVRADDGKGVKVTKVKKEPKTEEEIRQAGTPKRAEPLHPLEVDYIKGADTYVKLMEGLKAKGKLGNRGQKVPEIMYLAAATYYDRGQYDEATKRFIQVHDFKPESKTAEIAVKTLIDIYARQKNWVAIEDWSRKMLARKGRIVLETADLRKYIVVAMAEQARELAEKKDFDGAHAKYDTILKEFRKDEPELAAHSMYYKAILYEEQKEDVKAIKEYEQVVKEFPKAKIAPEAMFAIGLVYEQMTQFRDAADAFLNMAKLRDNADAAQALINAGAILNALQNYKESAAAYDKFIGVAGSLKPEGAKDTARATDLKAAIPDAEMEKAHVLEKMGPEGAKMAATAYQVVATKYGTARPDLAVESLGRRVGALRLENAAKNRKDVVKTADAAVKAYQAKDGAKGRAPYFYGEAVFNKAEYDFDDFDVVTLKNVKKMSQLGGVLQKKAELLKKAEKSYHEVMDATLPTNGRSWAAASAYRVGLLYFKFKEDLFNAPIPPEVKANPDLEDKYRQEIEKLAVPIEEQALAGLNFAITLAHNAGVYNKWSKEAGDYAARVNPNAFPTIEKDPNLPKAITAVKSDKSTDAATSAAFVTSVRRGKLTASYKPKAEAPAPK
jgi:TolA-binding protein